VLVLALDTATPAATAGVVEVTADSVATPPEQRGRGTAIERSALHTAPASLLRALHVTHDARKHGERLLPLPLAACAQAGVTLPDVDAVVVGVGPGPFTGLRVGMVTAAALGDALGVPVHGVCSLDAIAAEAVGDADTGGPLLVVTDARRREVYWAAYDGGVRISGPHVEAPAALVDRIPGLGAVAAAGASAGVTGLRIVPPDAPGPTGLVACALDVLRAGVRPGPMEPVYLRRPDAVAPGPRKPVTAG
jgi:tRNA threonylcarbamoyl adenosine modification protein YeaZ